MKNNILKWLLGLIVLIICIISITPNKPEKKPTIEVECTKDTCNYDTISYSVFDVVDKYCKKYDVPEELIFNLGLNESGWRNIEDSNYCLKTPDCGKFSYGDLQIWSPTRKSIFKKLNLTGITRENCIHASIYYMKYQYNRYGSWYKARFAYGRGSWRPEHTWKPIERKFMNKHNWKQYDE